MPSQGLSLWMLVPYQVRVGLWLALLAIVAFLAWRLDGALDDHYTAKQNALVAQDAARTNASALKLSEAHLTDTKALLARRDARIRALESKGKDQDDEMQRLKQAKPENRDWAEGVVPPDIAARHNGVR